MRNSLIAALASTLFFSSCIVTLDGSYDGLEKSLGSGSYSRSPAKIARENRSLMGSLQPGMTIAEVQAIMDQPSTKKVSNPHRTESFPLSDTLRADVFFYYTETISSDGVVTEEELTPVWFENGLLIGWGRSGFGPWQSSSVGS